MRSIQDLESLVAAIERQGANVAPTYQEYMPLAFAVANDFGEAGRPFFHRVCRLSEKYREDEAERLYDHALRNGKGANGFGSIVHWARLAGVRLDKRLSDTTFSVNEKATPREESENLANLRPSDTSSHAHVRARETETTPPVLPPVFPHHEWPSFLCSMVGLGDSPAQRDILLLGAITVLGATLNKWVRVSYGRKYYSPCLQTFVVAPPASGKGALTWVRHLAEPIHEEMMANYRERHKAYRMEKCRWDSLGKERSRIPEPEMPRLKMFLISGNNSSTGVLENLIDAEGVGLICESEADTVSAAIGTDYGNWSDTLRKCHDHDRLAFNRRTNHEYRECERSYLSVLLSGTPAQVKPLIPSAENGLFSRQLFYCMPPIEEWVDQFDRFEEDLDRRFAFWGRQWKQLLDGFRKSVHLVQLRLTKEQQSFFNQHFARLFGHASVAGNGAMRGAVARIAINACRMVCVVAFLRAVERLLPSDGLPDLPAGISPLLERCPGLIPSPEIPAENVHDGIVPKLELQVSDRDFQAVLSLIEPLYRHSCHVLGYLPEVEVKARQGSPREELFDALPLTFTRQRAVEEAAKRGIPVNTLDSYLRRMREKGILTCDTRGEYMFASRVRTCARERDGA